MPAALDLSTRERPIADPAAIGEAEFAALMARFAPFEPRPHLAVGVSGGSDSLALTLLANRWARARGGQVSALTVDHGLRAESAAEAAQVGAWLAARDIAQRTLRWDGPKPMTGVQAAARDMRRALLTAWCREHGTLHLLLAHQRGDQAETWLMRRERKSGPDGLAGMAAVVELHDLRLLRPLLDVPAERLRATLSAHGQPWIEDPSNANARFTRTRLRQDLTCGQADAAAIIAATRQSAGRRQAREAERATLLAQVVSVYPEGWARLDGALLRRGVLPPEALARVLMVVGGGAYAPRRERLERLGAALVGAQFEGATLAGCQLLPRRGDVLVVRELAATAEPVPIGGPGRYRWDDRFTITVGGMRPFRSGAYQIARLDRVGWRQVTAAAPHCGKTPLTAAICSSLPALWDLDGVREVPHLLYRRRGADPDSVMVVSAMFCPRQALAGPGFLAL